MAWTLLRFTALSGRTRAFLMVLLVLAPLLVANPVQAHVEHQLHAVTWSRTYQPIVGTDAFTVTSDGGFIIGGQGFGRGLDAWVMKADSNGEPEWEKNYHPTGYPYSTSVVQVLETRGGGYLVVGHVLFGGPWLLKLNHKGDIQWSKIYRSDSFSHVEQTLDGGYIAAGNFGTIGTHDSNGWVLKLDPEGNITWQETFEGQDIYSIDQANDGGFVLAGTVGEFGKADGWVVKLDPNGNVIWQKAYETVGNSGLNSVQQAFNGGYMAAGGGLFLRLDSKGNILWQKSYSGGGSFSNSLHQTSDGGFIVSGRSIGPWVLRLDSTGNISWQKIYGGLNDFLLDSQATSNGGFIAAGWLYASGYAWVLRLNSEGIVRGCILGAPSNATLTNAAATARDTALSRVITNAATIMTFESVNTPQPALQTSCPSIRDEHRQIHLKGPIWAGRPRLAAVISVSRLLVLEIR